MSSERGNLEKQSDYMDQTDPAKDEIEERIRKKEKELKQIASRIELRQKERELDEKIRQANDLESFYTNNATDGQIAAAKDNHERDKKISMNPLTTKDLVENFRYRQFSEDEEKLCRFAMYKLAEENMKGRIYDAELLICFAPNNTETIKKGSGKQRLVICFDEDNKPVFRWEVKTLPSTKIL